MSFLVAVYVNEGIVLASDRRSTYTQTENINGLTVQKIGIHVTNSTDKTFICPNGAGISTCGDASIMGKPITGFIQDMIHSKIKEETSVKEIPQIIIDYFSNFVMTPNVNFLVAGYAADEDSTQNQKLYKIVLKVQPNHGSPRGATNSNKLRGCLPKGRWYLIMVQPYATCKDDNNFYNCSLEMRKVYGVKNKS